MRKYIINFLLVFVLCTLCIRFPVSANEVLYSGQCGDDVYWTLDDNGTMTLSGSGKMWERYSDYFDGETHDREYEEHLEQIRCLVVEEGITGIGSGAFERCVSLEKVVLPEGVLYLGRSAFQKSSALTEINIPSSVDLIDGYCFSDCGALSEIDLSATQELNIGNAAFQCSGLKHITIPDSIFRIESKAFSQCSNLESADLGDGLDGLADRFFAGCTNLKEVKGGTAITYLGFNVFYNLTDYCPCVTVNEMGQMLVGNWLLDVPDTVECVTIPANITVVAYGAFGNCSQLNEIRFEGNLPEIFWGAMMFPVDVVVFPAGNDTWSHLAYKKGEEVENEHADDVGMFIPSDHVHDFADEKVPVTGAKLGYTMRTCKECGYRYFTDLVNSGLPFDINEWKMLQGVNRHRYQEAINPLTATSLMQQFAEIRGEESVLRVLNHHTRPDGSSYKTVAPEIGLTGYTNLRENLYWGSYNYTDPEVCGVDYESALRKWMDSQIHREAIMMPSLTVVGIDAKIRGGNECWVQNFAAGGTYNSFRLVAELGMTVEQGTKIDDLPIYAELNNTAFGLCWLPIIEEYCTGYDSQKIGPQTVTVNVMGYSASFEVTVIEKEHNYERFGFVFPTCTHPGFYALKCTDCGAYSRDYFLPSEGHSFGDWTSDGSGMQTRVCSVCGTTESRTAPRESPFADVKEEDYFFEPVLWAFENGVTGGVAPNLFGSLDGCTRAQVVTFLWSAAGKPAPTSSENPFDDVAEGQYYYDAVQWAMENGITSGLSADTFGPDVTCTRGQIVTFLWRAIGKSASADGDNPFTDVDESAYYYTPVLWAVEKGITAGTSPTEFSPDATCTRGQIVTFLYKAYN